MLKNWRLYVFPIAGFTIGVLSCPAMILLGLVFLPEFEYDPAFTGPTIPGWAPPQTLFQKVLATAIWLVPVLLTVLLPIGGSLLALRNNRLRDRD